MKKNTRFWISLSLLFSLLLLNSCDPTTNTGLPVLTTKEVSSITYNSASCGGNITTDAGMSVIVRGVCWSTSSNPTIANSKTSDGAGIGSFTSAITGLTEATTYYVRAYATNSAGTAYGSLVSFTRFPAPNITTTTVTSIKGTTASSGGNVSSDGGTPVTDRGVCWRTKTNPTIADSKTVDGAGVGSFTSSITGLIAGTTYFVRAYATTSIGTEYGNEAQITTVVATPNVTDIDGNVYHTITIGTQVWMVENLKTTKYNDGTSIPNVTDNTAWHNLSTPAYCWFNNNATTYKNTYGALYNRPAVITGKLALSGWHVPTDAEWTTLENYVSADLGTSGSVAKALAATINWSTSTSEGAIGNDLSKNNSSGFSALPGGDRDFNGSFGYVGYDGTWWSSSQRYISYSWWYSYKRMSSGFSSVYGYVTNDDSRNGFSVRCVRD